MKTQRGRQLLPAPLQSERFTRKLALSRLLLFVRHLGAIGCAATLALARVLALAGVLFFCFLVGLLFCGLILGAERRLHAREQIGSLNTGAGSREQARDRRTRNQVLI